MSQQTIIITLTQRQGIDAAQIVQGVVVLSAEERLRSRIEDFSHFV